MDGGGEGGREKPMERKSEGTHWMQNDMESRLHICVGICESGNTHHIHAIWKPEILYALTQDQGYTYVCLYVGLYVDINPMLICRNVILQSLAKMV